MLETLQTCGAISFDPVGPLQSAALAHPKLTDSRTLAPELWRTGRRMSAQLHVRQADLEWPDDRQCEIELKGTSVSSTRCGCLHKHSCDECNPETRLNGSEISRAISMEACLTCNCADFLRPIHSHPPDSESYFPRAISASTVSSAVLNRVSVGFISISVRYSRSAS